MGAKLSIIRHREAQSNTISVRHDSLIPGQIGISDSWVQFTGASRCGKVEPNKARVFTLHARQLQGHAINDGDMISGFRMKEKTYRKLVTLPCQFLQPLSSTTRKKFQPCVPRERSENTSSNDWARIIKNLIISTHRVTSLFFTPSYHALEESRKAVS